MTDIALQMSEDQKLVYLEAAQRAAMCLNNPAGKLLLDYFEAKYARRVPWFTGPDGVRETDKAIGKMEVVWELMSLVQVGIHGIADEPAPSTNRSPYE